MRYPVIALCALGLLALVPLHGEATDSLITASDLLKIKSPGAPAISPDHKQVAYTVRGIEAQPDAPGSYGYRTRLWLVSLDGRGGPHALTQGLSSARSPAWSPSGDRLAYVETTAGSSLARLWIIPLAGGGAPYPVTPALPGLDSPRWSPDGTRLLFTATLAADAVHAALVKNHTTSVNPPWPALARPSRPPAVLAPAPVVPGPVPSMSAAATPALDKPSAPPAAILKSPATSPATPPATLTATPPAPSAKPIVKTPPARRAPPPSSAPAAPKITPDPDGLLVERRAWLHDNETARNPRVTWQLDFDDGHAPSSTFTHIYTVTASADSTPADLTPGYASYDEPIWAPDGQHIFCTGPADPALNPDLARGRGLYSLAPDGTALHPLPVLPGYSAYSPRPSPDGKTLAWIAQPDKAPGDLVYGLPCVATLTLSDGKSRLLTEKFDRAALNPRWFPDGKFIYFTAPSNGGYVLCRVPPAGGKPDRLTSQDTGVSDYDLAPDDIALVIAKAANPGELYRTGPTGRGQRILTAHNNDWLRDKQVAPLERHKLKQPDGTDIDYWILRPTYLEGGLHYPLLVTVHGGPGDMWGPGEPALWHELQFFAARGYTVVFCNPRGSDGYGRAFLRASYRNWAPGPGSDVLAVATAATTARDSGIDPDRQVLVGGSYGGYLATWLLTQDTRFKAAIAARGLYDLTTSLGQGDAAQLVPWQFGGYPWQPEIRQLLDAQSPLTHLDTLRTPLLLEEDSADTRVGNAQTELLYRSLQLLNRPVELVRYPGATHSLNRDGDPAQRIDRLVRYEEFLERFVGPPAQPMPPPPKPPAPAPRP